MVVGYKEARVAAFLHMVASALTRVVSYVVGLGLVKLDLFSVVYGVAEKI
jgi:hypothetical protein